MSQSNETQRVAYIVTYKHRSVLKRLEKLPCSISYNSKSQKQVLIYFDERHLKTIENQLKKAKGFVEMEPSGLFQEEILNF